MILEKHWRQGKIMKRKGNCPLVVLLLFKGLTFIACTPLKGVFHSVLLVKGSIHNGHGFVFAIVFSILEG